GGNRPVKVDTRLVAATNEDLPTLAEQGKFRADLLDRLAFDVITLPPLRERREDILLLAEEFAINMARELGYELFSGFTEKARKLLLDHHWPGNIRERKNVVERSVYRVASGHVPVHDIVLDPFDSPWRPATSPTRVTSVKQTNGASPQEQAHPNPTKDTSVTIAAANGADWLPDWSSGAIDFKQLSQDFETDVLQQALQKAQFNQKKTAELLGLTYHQLRGYLKKYQLLEGTNGSDA